MKKLSLLMFCVVACTRYSPVTKTFLTPPEPKPEVPTGELTKAAYVGNLSEVRRLVEMGANVNEIIETEELAVNPLAVAISEGHEEVALYLVTQGASKDQTVDGFSLVEVANENGLKKIK